MRECKQCQAGRSGTGGMTCLVHRVWWCERCGTVEDCRDNGFGLVVPTVIRRLNLWAEEKAQQANRWVQDVRDLFGKVG